LTVVGTLSIDHQPFSITRTAGTNSMAADSGRLENRLWAFFTPDVGLKKSAGWQPDPQIECLLVTKAELKNMVLTNQLEHALHLAVIGQAVIRGFFSFN